MIVKRRCVNLVSTEAFDIFSQGEDSERCGNSWGDPCGLSDCDPVTWTGVPVVLVVTDVLVSPFFGGRLDV